jgi:tetratricopeptide (TPR) repeat protein
MRARRRYIAAVALAFAVALAVFTVTRGDERAAAGPPVGVAPEVVPGATTDEEIRRLQGAVRDGAPLEAQLAAAYLQKVRETGDPGFYTRADGLLRRALGRGPEDADELNVEATLAAGRHDFERALSLAERARALQPDALDAYPILVDALVELGRYDRAERVLQGFIDRKPSLASYSRVAYFRELHGDLGGAAEAMSQAVSAGSIVPENLAYVRTRLGNLEQARGRLAPARRAYTLSMFAVRDYAPALAGRARLAARRGDLDRSIALWKRIVARLPLPEYAIALGEAELAAGRRVAGARDLDLVRAQQSLLESAGVNSDLEFALFEADHGDPARGVELARRAWEAAPSVRSADALGWALTRSGRPTEGARWARRALRLGSVDPMFRFHAGMSYLEAGRRAEGRRHLRVAVANGLASHPLQAERARRALKES